MQNDQFPPDLVDEDEALMPFDVRDSSGKQGLLKLFIGVALLLTIAFLLLKFYQPGTRDRDVPPRITAENTPFKVKPEEVGGLQAPDQDKKVFDVMDGNPPESEVKNIVAPEEPIDLPKTDNSVANIQLDPAPSNTNSSNSSTSTNPSSEITTPPASTGSVNTQTGSTRTGTSRYVVQVASLRTPTDAQAVWEKLQGKFSAELGSGIYGDIKRVDLNEKGIYYRTRVAGLADKKAATSLCNRFKAAGQSCFVTVK